MDDKTRELLQNALGVFVRYGYRRTTMGDIAAAARMSRPTLYLKFNSKEAVFAAVVDMFVDDAMARIRGGLPARKSLSDKLMFAFEVWTIQPYELTLSTPEAKDLVGVPLKGLDRGHSELAGIMGDLLRDSMGAKNADQSARVMVAAALGFKERASDVEALRGLFKGLIVMVLAQGRGKS